MTLSPSVRLRQQRIARAARRLPGYSYLSEKALPRVRSSAVLNDLAWRVFAMDAGLGSRREPLEAGKFLTGGDVDLLPVVGVLALGMNDEDAESLMGQLGRAQQDYRSFRVVLILDHPAFPIARRHGYVVEVLTPAEDWAHRSLTWHDHVARRIGSVAAHYRTAFLLRAEDGRLSDLDLAVLRDLGRRLPEDRDVHAPGQGERKVPDASTKGTS